MARSNIQHAEQTATSHSSAIVGSKQCLRRTLTTSPLALRPSLDTSTSPSSSSTATLPPSNFQSPGKGSNSSEKEGKEAGTIASVFASLSGGTLEDAFPTRFADLKQSLITSPSHAEHLKRTWRDVLSSLAARVEETAKLGGDCIPEVTYPSTSGGQVGPLESWTDTPTFEAIKDRGVAVIRNVIPRPSLAVERRDSSLRQAQPRQRVPSGYSTGVRTLLDSCASSCPIPSQPFDYE